MIVVQLERGVDAMPTNQPIVSREYAGKWIAWDHEMTRIVGSGATPREAWDAAIKAGEARPILGKSPPASVRMIGPRTR
jgi:hypothetical protein